MHLNFCFFFCCQLRLTHRPLLPAPGQLFRSWAVLGCIAHLIKGGIFYFYGIITFARYLGCFAEKGWAWNRVDGASKFSFEMIESFLIFTYGITNTWMEHFGQNPEWTHKDFEHASLAFM